ncbi:MAG TPA: hypothetical protein VFQ95_07435 [Rhodanobacteraceae bacterium]|nr:hypothetical protein [Rhodanobacteraceae bacterium]
MNKPDWARPHWQRDAQQALLVYFVFGAFAEAPKLESLAFGLSLPAGFALRRMPRASFLQWQGNPLRGGLGESLRADDPDTFELANRAFACLVLRGEIADAPTLDYLRSALAVQGTLFDAGAVAIVDPQMLEIFSAARWRERYVGASASDPRRHVLILQQKEPDGGAWIKTHGMRKFARPDVSIRDVPARAVQSAGAVAARLVELQARGMRFGDDSKVEVEGVPGGLTVKRGGTLDDPEFNNTHLELRWPAA